MKITYNNHILHIYEDLFNYLKTVKNVHATELYKNICQITGWTKSQANVFTQQYTAGRRGFKNKIALLKVNNKTYSFNPSLGWNEEDVNVIKRYKKKKGEKKRGREKSRMVCAVNLLEIPEHWNATNEDIENVFKLAYARLGYKNIKNLPDSAPDLTYNEAMKELGIDSVGGN